VSDSEKIKPAGVLINIVCSGCGSTLDGGNALGGGIEVKPCQQCTFAARNEGHEEGYEQGFTAGGS